MRHAGLDEAQAGIKIAGRNISNLRHADDTTLRAESEEELKSLLRRVKEESEKVGLKLNIQKTKIMVSSPITSWWIDGETVETVADFILGAPKPLQMVIAAMKLKDTPWQESYDQPRQHIKKQRHYFANKGLYSQGYGFSSGHVWLWELDYKESWVPKNWCFWIVMLEKTLKSPLDCKEIQPVHPKGDQSWVFTGLMLKLKLQYFGHLMRRADSFEETLMLRKIEGRRRRGGMTEDEMVRWHHWLNGHKFGEAAGVGDGQEGLECCSSWDRRVGRDWATELNWITSTEDGMNFRQLV